MKLEFLENGSPDCPLIRLYAFDSTEAMRFREILLSLSYAVCERLALQSEPGVEAIEACQLNLQLGQRDLGMIRRDRAAFNCVFTARTWRTIAALVEPFCQSAAPGHYQWLTGKGDALLLLSVDESW